MAFKDYSNLVGKKYGRLRILEILPRVPKKFPECIVKCDCGKIKTVRIYDVANHKIQSCGCARSRKGIERETPYIAKKLNAKYECRHTVQECMRSSVCHICCCECDKYKNCCMACKNTPEKCGAKKR